MATLSLVEMMKDSSVPLWRGTTRAERFLAKCEKRDSGCVIHRSGTVDKDGYPMIHLKQGGRLLGRRASHVSLAIVGIAVPKGQQVNHRCDNRKCVNPDHLFIGTQGDNVRDMMSKRRHVFGERQRKALLTEDAVRDIKANCTVKGQPAEFAKKYGVSVSTIRAVRVGQNWGHINA